MDADALDALYRSYAAELRGSLARRYPRSADVVEDAVQHAFMKLQDAKVEPDEPRAWLRTVARHYVLDRLRADGKLVSDDEVIDELPASTATAETKTGAVTTTLVHRALLMLTTRAQRILRGKYEEGKSYDTLSEQEGIAKSGMGRILDRARARLRGAVEQVRGDRREGQK